MTKHDYTAFDAALIDAIRNGAKHFTVLSQRMHNLAEPFAKPEVNGETHVWRVVDRRLQALRKAGRIEPNRRDGWRIVGE